MVIQSCDKTGYYWKAEYFFTGQSLAYFSELVICFVQPIFLSFCFWYFGHCSCVIFFPFFPSCPSCLASNVDKDYLIFLSFHNFVAKRDQKTKNGMKEMFLREKPVKSYVRAVNSKIKSFKNIGIQIFLLTAVCNIELTLGFCLLLRYRKVTILRRTGSKKTQKLISVIFILQNTPTYLVT